MIETASSMPDHFEQALVMDEVGPQRGSQQPSEACKSRATWDLVSRSSQKYPSKRDKTNKSTVALFSAFNDTIPYKHAMKTLSCFLGSSSREKSPQSTSKLLPFLSYWLGSRRGRRQVGRVPAFICRGRGNG